MAFIRRRRSETSESVELVAAGNGLVVQGSPTAVTTFVDLMTGLTESGRARRVLVDGLAVVGNVAALVNTHREYFEFAPEALARLREHGAIPAVEGWFRSFVRSGEARNSPFAGNLDWRPVDLAPEQALAMQTMLVNLALRAAIKEVAVAVERVEGKVDKLVTLARAERLGSAIGDRLTLEALAERTRAEGRLSNTDWSTVDSLGALIARDIAALRAYVLRALRLARSRRQARRWLSSRSRRLRCASSLRVASPGGAGIARPHRGTRARTVARDAQRLADGGHALALLVQLGAPRDSWRLQQLRGWSNAQPWEVPR